MMLLKHSVCATGKRAHMRRDIARAQVISPPQRLRLALWLFLALVLTLAVLLHLGRTVAIAATLPTGVTHVQISIDDQLDNDCSSHGGAIVGSHCYSGPGCVAAILSGPRAFSPPITETALFPAPSTPAFGFAPSPSFHPPKLVVQV